MNGHILLRENKDNNARQRSSPGKTHAFARSLWVHLFLLLLLLRNFHRKKKEPVGFHDEARMTYDFRTFCISRCPRETERMLLPT